MDISDVLKKGQFRVLFLEMYNDGDNCAMVLFCSYITFKLHIITIFISSNKKRNILLNESCLKLQLSVMTF